MTMEYMILLHSDESAAPDFAPGSPEFDEMMGEWMSFNAELAEGNHLIGGASLAPTLTATTLHKSPEGNSTTDGPYAETKEQLGGFYVIEAADLDEALAIAAKVPIPYGSFEVRPIAFRPEV
ncbi:MAG: YciI family protein [Ilumatobacter sp.]